MRKESREGTEDFTPDLERFPLDDAWLQIVEEEPWKEKEKGLGLGESECMTIRTGMYEAGLDFREAPEAREGEEVLRLSPGVRTREVNDVVFFCTSDVSPGFCSAALGLDSLGPGD